jgi:hypothetical protein
MDDIGYRYNGAYYCNNCAPADVMINVELVKIITMKMKQKTKPCCDCEQPLCEVREIPE